MDKVGTKQKRGVRLIMKDKTKNDVLMEKVESLISEIEEVEQKRLLKMKRTIHNVSYSTYFNLGKYPMGRFRTAEFAVTNSLASIEIAKNQLKELDDVLMNTWYKEHKEEIKQQLDLDKGEKEGQNK